MAEKDGDREREHRQDNSDVPEETEDAQKSKDVRHKSRHRSAFGEALSILKYMHAMNPGNIAPIPDDVSGRSESGGEDASRS